MPNQREPVTVTILHKICALCAIMHDNSLKIALCDWNVLSIYYGFCLSEWAQNTLTKSILLHSTDGSPIAFAFNNITFYSVNYKWLHQTWETILDSTIVVEV